MKTVSDKTARGFTLIEILLALAIFGLVLTAIYASWTAILKASKSGLEAAAQVQRERIAIRTIEEALTSSRSFAADLQHYGFVAENGSEATLSFGARLPKSFPRSGKFGDLDVRRVSFSVESGHESQRQLVLRQSPIMMEFDQDEKENPLVLAKNVKELQMEFWDTRTGDWVEEWNQTNSLPRLMKITLRLASPNQGYGYSQTQDETTRIVALPSIMVPAAWQVPNLSGAAGSPPPNVTPGIVPPANQQRGRVRPNEPLMKIVALKQKSGIALIIVLIAMTVLGILAAGFAYSMKVETKLAQNANSEAELIWLGRSGVEYARYVLAQQLALGCEPYDSLDQVWAGGGGGICTSNSVLAGISLKDFQLSDGKFSVTITDLERKFNINILPERERERGVEQALRLVGVDAGDLSAITGSILDWIDSAGDIGTHVGGKESDYYQSLNPPYNAKNGPVDDLSELLLVYGVTPEIFWGGVATNHPLAAFQRVFGRAGRDSDAVAYPVGLSEILTPISNGRININTATLTTLQMVPMVDENIAARIIDNRSEGEGFVASMPIGSPGKTIGNALLNAGVNPNVIPQIERYFTVRSSTFEVQVDAEIAGYKRQFFAILARNNPRDVQVLSFYWK